jgi:hypothetical protein
VIREIPSSGSAEALDHAKDDLLRAEGAGRRCPVARGVRLAPLPSGGLTVRMMIKMACTALTALLAIAVSAQETKKSVPEGKKPAPAAKKAEAAQAPAMPVPKPGPEHEMLKKDVGTWDATVELMMPNAPPTKSKGVETNKMVGDLWLVTDFKSQMMGRPFQGHGTTGYDPNKKKYVGTWVDTMSSGLNLGESTYDPATRTVTGWMDGPDETGKPTRSKMVTEYKDDNTRVFSMYMTGPDGKEFQSMKITYKRRTAAAAKK